MRRQPRATGLSVLTVSDFPSPFLPISVFFVLSLSLTENSPVIPKHVCIRTCCSHSHKANLMMPRGGEDGSGQPGDTPFPLGSGENAAG